MATKKLILDLDMGVDDAMALAYAIASPEVELVGITTCFGNVRVEQSAHNCLAVLDLLGRPEVPVYLGADRPMKATEPYTPPASTTLIHGKNGIGGASVPASPYEPVGATSADGNAAVDYLIDAARTYGPDLVYVATGPLTNLALALERDAAAMMSIGRASIWKRRSKLGQRERAPRPTWRATPRLPTLCCARAASSPWWAWM